MELPNALSSFSTLSLRSVSLASSCKGIDTFAHRLHPLKFACNSHMLNVVYCLWKQRAATWPATPRDRQGVYRTGPPLPKIQHSNSPLAKQLLEFLLSHPFRRLFQRLPLNFVGVYESSLIRIEPRAGRCVSATVADSFSYRQKNLN